MNTTCTVSRRPIGSADEIALRRIVGSDRREMLASAGLVDSQVESLADQQYDVQLRSYRSDYPDAVWESLLLDEAIVGRVVTHDDGIAITLVDIVVDPDVRGRGIGERVLTDIIAVADAGERSISLSVDKHNQALRWYRRHGFEVVDETPLQWQMRRHQRVTESRTDGAA